MNKSIDEIWEKIHSNRAWGVYPSEHVIRFVARNYYSKCRSDIKILDFGCGQGAHTWYLAREGFDTYAFDGSESAVKKTKTKLDKEGLNAKLSVFDALSIDYPFEYFDAVIDSLCIYSNRISDIRKMYESVFRILKSGGKLLTICFGEDVEGYTSGQEIEHGTYEEITQGALAQRGRTHIFTKAELIEILREIGFSEVICEWCKYTDRGNLIHQYICTATKD